MSILARLTPTNLTLEKYNRVNERLEQAGAMPPDGLEYHVCFGDDGNLRVSEVWESQEKMQTFGETLMPILQEVGVEISPPEFLEVHNQIRP
jgi:hypothetical protein